MVTKITCQDCGASLGIKGEVRAVIECPKCGAEIHTITVDEDGPAEESTRKPKSKSKIEEEPRRKPNRNVARDEEAPEDDKPRKKAKKSANADDDDESEGKKKGKKKKKGTDKTF